MTKVYKLKTLASGAEKVIEKDSSFNPPKEKQEEGVFEKLERVIEVLFEGVYIIGADKMLRWRMVDNMMRTDSAFSSVKMLYQIVAPRMYLG